MKKLQCLKCERRFWTRVQGLCRKHRAKTKRREPRIPKGTHHKKPVVALPKKKDAAAGKRR